MAPSSLTAAERETVISMNDEDDFASVWTAQRPVITKLKRNSAATLVEEGHYGSTAWARFEMPRDRVSFRSLKRSRKLSPGDKAAAVERMAKARAAKSAI